MESNRECIIAGCTHRAELHQAVCKAHVDARTDGPCECPWFPCEHDAGRTEAERAAHFRAVNEGSR